MENKQGVPQFGSWLRTQKTRSDAIGDLAQDWESDPARGRRRSAYSVRARMIEAHASGAAFAALDAAEREYMALYPRASS